MEQLLAQVIDEVRGGNWQRAGNKNAPRPKPVPRPGVEDAKSAEKIGGKSYTAEQMRALLDRYSLGVN